MMSRFEIITTSMSASTTSMITVSLNFGAAWPITAPAASLISGRL